MEHPREGSPYNACSTLLSIDSQIMDHQSTSKAASGHGSGCGGLQQTNLNKTSTSSNNNIDDDQYGKGEQLEENAHNSTCNLLQGSMIFDMLSAMQFNAHSVTLSEQAHTINNSSILNISTPNPSSNQKAAANLSISNNNNNMMSPEGSPPWHLHLYNNNAARAALDAPIYQAHHTIDNSMQQSAAPPISTFDPIASFLKLPVLADQSQLVGLAADQRLVNSSYINITSCHKEDNPLYTGKPAQAPYSLASNNNWFNSLHLEGIRDCSNVNNDNMEHSGSHIVQHLDHHHLHHLEGASEEAKLLMKLNGEEVTMSSHDNVGRHEERMLLNESFNSTSMHMLHNEEELLYTLNEGGDNIEGGHGSGMLENMHMMMMGYNNDPRANNAEFGAVKGISTCSSIMGASVKTTRKRGVRGSGKNSEDRENQRMTHIAVERNRRRQMNEHLRVLRALMPPSYIQRGDQASIIGGAIEFVRELEQLLQCLESQKRRRIMVNPVNVMPQPAGALQPSLLNTQAAADYGVPSSSDHHLHHQLQAAAVPCMLNEAGLQNIQEEVAQAKSAVADIEVKVVEKSEALIKILSQRRPRQLLLTIQALQEHLHLCILHTNVTTIDNTVLYSFTVKIHHDFDYSANHIAALVHEIFIDITDQNPLKHL